MSRDPSRDLQFINALKNERMKTYVKRDGSERVIVLYEAVIGAEDGDQCLATVYTYSGSNTVPQGSKEKDAIWDSDWDTDLDAILVNGDVGYTP